MGTYCTAQICTNGHCITTSIRDNPALLQDFCQECSAPTITECPECHEKIRGRYVVEGIYSIGNEEYDVPKYCCYCGAPYPWTQAAIETATSLLEEDKKLSKSDREKLTKMLPDLITQPPRTSLAVLHLKKVMASAAKVIAEGLRQFVIDFCCDFAKRLFGL